MHNLQNRKVSIVIVHYLAKISQLMHLKVSAKLHADDNTSNATGDCVQKNL